MNSRRTRTVDPITHEPIDVDDSENDRIVDVTDDRVGYGGAIPPEEALEYPPPETRVIHDRVPYAVSARGGISPIAILSGMLTAFGVMLIGSAITGVVAANTDINVSGNEAVRLGLLAGGVFVAVQLIAYLWGGYTAGRMARGAGAVNGFLVPLAAIAAGALTILIVRATGNEPNLAVPFQNGRFGIDRDTIYNFGAWVGIASLAAMFIGGMIGGSMGARWHRKLERSRTATDYYDDAQAEPRTGGRRNATDYYDDAQAEPRMGGRPTATGYYDDAQAEPRMGGRPTATEYYDDTEEEPLTERRSGASNYYADAEPERGRPAKPRR